MKAIILLKAINDVQDDYIEEAAPKGYLKTKGISFSWFTMKSLVPLAAIFIVGIFIGRIYFNPQPELIDTPYQPCASLQEAEKITGYALSIPSSLQEETAEVVVYDGSMTEINILDEGQVVLSIRKGKGDADISGDYEIYDQEEAVEIDGSTVMIKGNDDVYFTAIWTKNGYSYSLNSENGLSKDMMMEYISQIE